jgi:hypothetical protein
VHNSNRKGNVATRLRTLTENGRLASVVQPQYQYPNLLLACSTSPSARPRPRPQPGQQSARTKPRNSPHDASHRCRGAAPATRAMQNYTAIRTKEPREQP